MSSLKINSLQNGIIAKKTFVSPASSWRRAQQACKSRKSCLSWASGARYWRVPVLKGERQYCPSRGQDLQVFLLPQRQQPHFSPCHGLHGGGEPSEIARLFSGVSGSTPSEHPHKAGLQPGRCRARPGHVPPAPVLLHPRGEFGPEITILFLQEAVQMLRTRWPRPVGRHGERQPPPPTSIFCTQSCFPSTAAVPGWRCCSG